MAQDKTSVQSGRPGHCIEAKEEDSERPAANYIHDEGAAVSLADLALQRERSSVSCGSSIEQEIEEEMQEIQVDGSSDQETAATPPARITDFAYLDQRQGEENEDEFSESSDWDVDDEDWELANGGGSNLHVHKALLLV